MQECRQREDTSPLGFDRPLRRVSDQGRGEGDHACAPLRVLKEWNCNTRKKEGGRKRVLSSSCQK